MGWSKPPSSAQGTEVLIAAPFDGDAGFFQVQPPRYSLNPPLAEIAESELLLRYVRTDQDGEAVTVVGPSRIRLRVGGMKRVYGE